VTLGLLEVSDLTEFVWPASIPRIERDGLGIVSDSRCISAAEMQTAILRSGVAETRRTNEAALALRTHWPEYLIELAALATFMISACIFGVLLEHPLSPFN